MAKRIKFGLSVNEINNAIKEVRKYKNDLQKKCEEFCSRLMQEGYVIAYKQANDSPLGKTLTFQSDISPTQAGCKAILFSTGQSKKQEGYEPVDTLMLVEFGAGIRYNKIPNPKAAELGMGVGTFPGQMHSFDDEGWYYMGEDEQWHHSYGLKATMPVYYASKTMREKMVKVAREVFG